MKARKIIGFVLSLISTIGINFIPLEMWLYADFSGAQSMILYWLESVSAFVLAIAFVLLFAPKSDLTSKVRTRLSVIKLYLLPAITFSSGAAVFFFFIVFKELASEIDLTEIATSMKWIAGFLLLESVADALLVRRLTLLQAQLYLNRSLGRIFLFFLSVFIGYFLILFGVGWFVVPFIVLKTISDVGVHVEMLSGYDDLAQKENPFTKDYSRLSDKKRGSKSERKVLSNVYFRKQF